MADGKFFAIVSDSEAGALQPVSRRCFRIITPRKALYIYSSILEAVAVLTFV